LLFIYFSLVIVIIIDKRASILNAIMDFAGI